MALEKAGAYALGFLMVAVLVVATFLALDGLDDNLTADSYAANATADITEGVANSVEMAPTWGTLIGVGILISIILGGALVGYGYGKSKGFF